MIMVLAPDKRAKAAWEKAKAEAEGESIENGSAAPGDTAPADSPAVEGGDAA
jgi:hypothetical protein